MNRKFPHTEPKSRRHEFCFPSGFRNLVHSPGNNDVWRKYNKCLLKGIQLLFSQRRLRNYLAKNLYERILELVIIERKH